MCRGIAAGIRDIFHAEEHVFERSVKTVFSELAFT